MSDVETFLFSTCPSIILGGLSFQAPEPEYDTARIVNIYAFIALFVVPITLNSIYSNTSQEAMWIHVGILVSMFVALKIMSFVVHKQFDSRNQTPMMQTDTASNFDEEDLEDDDEYEGSTETIIPRGDIPFSLCSIRVENIPSAFVFGGNIPVEIDPALRIIIFRGNSQHISYAVADHPIIPTCKRFYGEFVCHAIRIGRERRDDVVVGFLPGSHFSSDSFPGHFVGFGFSSSGKVYSSSNFQDGFDINRNFFTGDVVGIGFDCERDLLFYTVNGDVVHHERVILPLEGLRPCIASFRGEDGVNRIAYNLGHEPFLYQEVSRSSKFGFSSSPSAPARVEVQTQIRISEPKKEVIEYIDEDGNLQRVEFFASEDDYVKAEEFQRESSMVDSPLPGRGSDVFPSFHDIARHHSHLHDDQENALGGRQEKGIEEVEVSCGSCCTYSLPFDRQAIELISDRDHGIFELIFSVAFFFGSIILAWSIRKHYIGFEGYVLWFVLATCQYALLRAPYLDANSPIPGDRSAAFSRVFHFCWMSGFVLGMNSLSSSLSSRLSFYEFSLETAVIALMLRNIFLMLILFFPLIFFAGLLPQVKTAFLFWLEQVNIYVFGGSGCVSLGGAMVEVLLSAGLVALTCLFGRDSFNTNFSRSVDQTSQILYLGFGITFSWILSRIPSNPSYIPGLLAKSLNTNSFQFSVHLPDRPFLRLLLDLLFAGLLFAAAAIFTILHIFHDLATTDRVLSDGVRMLGGPTFWTIFGIVVSFGCIIHYLIPQFRKPFPFLCLTKNILSNSDSISSTPIHYEISRWFKRVERMLLLFLVVLITVFSVPDAIKIFGETGALIIVTICYMKTARSVIVEPNVHWAVLSFLALFHHYDFRYMSQSAIVDYGIGLVIYNKVVQLITRVEGIFQYTNPFSRSDSGSSLVSLHLISIAFLPLAFALVIFATLFDFTIFPLIGSGAFFISYQRPVRFWERDYQSTNLGKSEKDSSRFALQNRNSIIYEQLAGTIRDRLGTWIQDGSLGSIRVGDVFFFVYDQRAAFVHVIELGSGFASFQLRGLELAGTYCHETERAEVLEDVSTSDSLCDDKFPCFLNTRLFFHKRIRTWQVVDHELPVDSYEVQIFPMSQVFPDFDSRRNWMKICLSSLIWVLSQQGDLEKWISIDNVAREELVSSNANQNAAEFVVPANVLRRRALRNVKRGSIHHAIVGLSNEDVDCHRVFSERWDPDFDPLLNGVSLIRFFEAFQDILSLCIDSRRRRGMNVSHLSSLDPSHPFVKLCYLFSIAMRKNYATIEEDCPFELAEFLQGLYRNFSCEGWKHVFKFKKERWARSIPNIETTIFQEATRYALRLYQDQFAYIYDYTTDPETLVQTLDVDYFEKVFIYPESDPRWNKALLSKSDELFTFRKVGSDSGSYSGEFQFLWFKNRNVNFTVARVNPEIARGLWTSVQHELLVLGNTNQERQSIQNMADSLRNLLVTSADLPCGYPIYVSPILTSFW